MEPSRDNLEKLDAAREADAQLIHALLLHLHDGTATQRREQRVQRAMQVIRSPATPMTELKPGEPFPRRLYFWNRPSAWAAAAMIFVAVGLALLISNQKPALASLNDVLGALARPGDRTFAIQVEPLDPEIQPRRGLDGAKLYTRDGQQYVLVRKDPNGLPDSELFDGFDGHQSWRIQSGKVAETQEGLGAGGLGMPQNASGALFVDLRQSMDRIRTDYTIERFDESPLPGTDRPTRHVLAHRNSTAVRGPEAIELWADPITAIPRRIVFNQGKLPGSTQPRRLTFNLLSEAPLDAKWFSAAAHIKATPQ